MKLIDAIRNVVIPSPEHDARWANTAPAEAICESLAITDMWMFPEAVDLALKSYPVFKWICTDTHVGLDALYLNGEPVGCSYRAARKSHHEIEWISEEAANKVRQFILDHSDRPEFQIMDPDQDIGEDFNVDYVGQALTDEGFYEGRPVKALVWYDGLSNHSTPAEYRREGRSYTEAVPYKDAKSNCVLVQDGDEQRVIPIDQFRLAFNVKRNSA